MVQQQPRQMNRKKKGWEGDADLRLLPSPSLTAGLEPKNDEFPSSESPIFRFQGSILNFGRVDVSLYPLWICFGGRLFLRYSKQASS